MLIYLIGLPGVGKTYWGKKLAHHIHYNFVDLDQKIENTVGIKIPDLINSRGEGYFRDLEKIELAKTTTLHNTIISTGGGTPCFFNNIELMNKYGKTIYLTAATDYIVENLKQEQAKRPLLPNQDLEPHLKKLLQEREFFYSKASFAIDCQGKKNMVDELTNLINIQI